MCGCSPRTTQLVSQSLDTSLETTLHNPPLNFQRVAANSATARSRTDEPSRARPSAATPRTPRARSPRPGTCGKRPNKTGINEKRGKKKNDRANAESHVRRREAARDRRAIACAYRGLAIDPSRGGGKRADRAALLARAFRALFGVARAPPLATVDPPFSRPRDWCEEDARALPIRWRGRLVLRPVEDSVGKKAARTVRAKLE